MVRNTNLGSMDPSFSNPGSTNFHSKSNDVHSMKRRLTLNLQDNVGNSRREKCNFSSPTVLESPDVKNFNLSTPDIMKFLVGGGNSRTPTPGTPLLPKDLYTHTFDSFPNFDADSNRNTSAQDDASKSHLENSRNTDSSSSFISIDNYNSLPVVDLLLPENITIKDEPQTVPSLNTSPRLSPIDMETQEEAKLERKRYRNRLAASKCRKRKLERISKLEDKVKVLKSENHDLSMMLSKLKGEVCTLKQKVMKHCNNGCHILTCGDM